MFLAIAHSVCNILLNRVSVSKRLSVRLSCYLYNITYIFEEFLDSTQTNVFNGDDGLTQPKIVPIVCYCYWIVYINVTSIYCNKKERLTPFTNFLIQFILCRLHFINSSYIHTKKGWWNCFQYSYIMNA